MLNNNLDFSNSIVVITGAAGDIGKSISQSFRDHGAQVVGIDISENTCSEIDIFMKGDITQNSFLSKIHDLVNELVEQKSLIIVNGAGITIPQEGKYSIENWGKVIDINLTSAFRIIESFRELLIDANRSKTSSIINITSLASGLGFPNNPSYAASKGGLNSLTKSYARDLGKYGVRVNAIAPGYVCTNMTLKSFENPEAKLSRDKHMMIKRWGEPEDIANGCLFLSSQLSSYITGIELSIDGGWSANGLAE